MSVYVIDGFSFPSTPGPGDEVYTISYNDVTSAITVSYSGTDGELTTVTSGQRGHSSADIVFQACDITVPATLNQFRATLIGPFAYIDPVIDSPSCQPVPPTCDLVFTSFASTNETEQNGNDGTITAVATTSFTGLQYSLDGVTWQSSGSFSGLSPGNYVLSAHDDNGCLITRGVSIQQYNNPILRYPAVQVSANNVSRWNAAYNPIVIEFQRNDNHIVSVADAGGGFIDVTINGLYDADQIEIATTTAVVIVSQQYNIDRPAISVTEVSGQSVLRFQNTFYGDATGVVFIEQDKPNYKIEIEITSGSSPFTSEIIYGTWSPNGSGFVRADMASFLAGLVNARDEFKYNVINWKDADRGASFTVRYREVWDGSDNPWYNAPYPMYVVYAAMQLQHPNGGNMAEFVPFYNEPNPSLKAKFMTDFEIPRSWIGLPWDISFIFSEGLVNTPLKMRTTSLDVNKQVIGSAAVDSFLLNSSAGFLTASPTGRFLIKRGALPPVVATSVIEALGVNRLMLAGNPGVNVEYFQIQLYRGTDDAPFFVTQPQIIKVDKPCDADPYIYLKWLNKLGGWNYWRFGYRQDYGLNVSNEVAVNRNVFDWSTDDTIKDIIKKSAFKSIEFGHQGLTLQESKGMESLPEAIRVQMLTNVNPYQWQTVIIQPGSFKLYSTRGSLFDVNFNLNLPEINIQRQ